MPALYPLRFGPIFRRYVWGGRRLATMLGKTIGENTTCAESWEVVDYGEYQSVVTNGPLAGTRLADLMARHGPELLGRHDGLDRFPLLFKFLDAHRTLSVQVHPDDTQAATLDPPDSGKTEAWVVLAAEPGSKIYAGLKRGVDRPALAREVARGTSELCLHTFEPTPGDCVLIPAGTVHTLGEGLVIAEIQQASDTTFRLFDWNRVGADGQSRELHIEQALAVIDFDRGPVNPISPKATEREHVERLVSCDKFVLDRWRLKKGSELFPRGAEKGTQKIALTPFSVGGDERFHLLAVLEGEVELAAEYQSGPLRKGDVVLLPASAGKTRITPIGETVVLDIWLP